jgi:hypothetical protein
VGLPYQSPVIVYSDISHMWTAPSSQDLFQCFACDGIGIASEGSRMSNDQVFAKCAWHSHEDEAVGATPPQLHAKSSPVVG